VVGLGNPGRRYARTRHNVGFRVIERLRERHRIALDAEAYGGRVGRGRIGGRETLLLEPQGFMNDSGGAVAAALADLPELDPGHALLVVYDDVDLPFGRLRLRAAGSSGGHRGMADVLLRLGRDDVARLRFGVGRSGPDTTGHVLEGFSAAEEAALRHHLERACDAVETWLAEGVESAMDRFNAAPPPPDRD
jgi:PTH1 family peptidyl-tRNA hydrolase